MSFLDDIKSRLPFGQNQQAQDYAGGDYDDYYDEDGSPSNSYADEGYQTASDAYGSGVRGYGYSTRDEQTGGRLGQTRRGEAESVAVYTRSGQLVGDADRHATTYNPPAREGSVRPGAYDTPSSYAESVRSAASVPSPAPAAEPRSSVLGATPQLPAYVLRPESYDDVETVVRRVRTRQPVALVFQGVRTEVAKRVLDFSYGFACGLGATVKEVGDRCFIVLPQGCEVKDTDLAKLRQDGYLKR